MPNTITFNGQQLPWVWWNGQQIKSTIEQPAGCDTETALIKPIREPRDGESIQDVPTDPRDIPKLAILLCCDSERLYVVHPSRAERFLLVNRSRYFTFHNAAFDWWVLHKHCGPAGKEALWTLAEGGRIKDTQIADLLIQLATGNYRKVKGGKQSDDEKLYPTNLGVLAAEWGEGEIDKKDEYRFRFGEWVGLTQEQIDAHPERDGFLSYCLPDVVTCKRIYEKQRVHALELMTKAGWSPKPQKLYEMRPDCVQKWDVLSLDIQVRASITLTELSRTPLRIDQQKRQELEAGTRERYRLHMQTMMELEPEVVQRYKPKKFKMVDGVKVRNEDPVGELKLNPKTGFPKISDKVLKRRLAEEAFKLSIEAPISKGKTRALSKSAKDWEHWKEESTFLTAFCGQASEQKLMSFFMGLEAPDGLVYTRYDLLKRSGRTSANQWKRGKTLLLPSVNVQQIPRENEDHPERDVRQLFVAAPGHKWLAVDYRAIEMATLAASCVARFGYSKIREGIANNVHRGGPDLHQITAAAIMGKPVEEFLRLPEKLQKQRRKEAKAVSFGYPGGMGAERFCQTVAKQGITFTLSQARTAKKVWMETFPEMKEHLADSTQLALSWQSGIPLKRIPAFSWVQKKRYGDYLKGKAELTSDEKDQFYDLIDSIGSAMKDEDLVTDAEKRKLTPRIRRLFEYRACSLTGRVRNNVTFSAAKNSAFQPCASDGAKEAIAALMRRGFKVIMFVHDEICFEVPNHKVEAARKQIEKIMVDEMFKVNGHDVPISVESGVADRWHKG